MWQGKQKRPRQKGTSKERYLWKLLLVLSISTNAFFVFVVNLRWLMPYNWQLDRQRDSQNLVPAIEDELSRFRKLNSENGNKSASNSSQQWKSPEKSSQQEKSSPATQKTRVDFGLPVFWLQPVNQSRLDLVLGNVKDFPPDDLPQVNATFFTPGPTPLSTYVPEMLILSSPCPQAGPFLLLVVPTVDSHWQIREAIRKTWASPLYGESWPNDGRNFTTVVKLVFFIGMGKPSNVGRLKTESKTFGDIVQANFTDSYRNLSLKMATVLQWSVTYCPGARHVMKVDEDTFVELALLVSLLVKLSQNRTRYVLGFQHLRQRPPVSRQGKWEVPKEVYPFPVFPSYVMGHSYVISGDAIKDLAWASQRMPLVPNEDAYLTGILSKAVGINKIHCASFAHINRQYKKCELLNGRSISQTGFKQFQQLYQMWAILKAGNCTLTS